MKILNQLLIIFTYSILGDIIAKLLPFPIPGSIIGLVLLFFSLKYKLVKLAQIEESGNWLKNNMGIMFVPLSVGIMNYFDLLSQYWLTLIVIIIFSTSLTYLVAAKVAEYSSKGESL